MSPYVFNPRAPAFQPDLSPTVTNPFSEGGRWAEPALVRERRAFFDLHVHPGDGSGLIPRTYSATSVRAGVQAEDVGSAQGQGTLFDFDLWDNGDHQVSLFIIVGPLGH